jgi:hypothetical protein
MTRVGDAVAQGVADPAEEEEVVLVPGQLAPPADDRARSGLGKMAEQPQTGLEQGFFDRINRSAIGILLLRRTKSSILSFSKNSSPLRDYLVREHLFPVDGLGVPSTGTTPSSLVD